MTLNTFLFVSYFFSLMRITSGGKLFHPRSFKRGLLFGYVVVNTYFVLLVFVLYTLSLNLSLNRMTCNRM